MEDVGKKIIRLATALHNACINANKNRQCNQCPFDVQFGCSLYEHPISWKDKLNEAKNSQGGEIK